ncbi:MAG: hypothetical protein ABSE90_07995 [Verrucomicrobiota bacterium]
MKIKYIILVSGTATVLVCIAILLWLMNTPKEYVVKSQVEKSGQAYCYVWTVHNINQSWGLDEFAVEVPIQTHVLTNSSPPPYHNPDGSAYWIEQETSEAQVDPHDGKAWLPTPEPGKKWILWSGMQSPSVYPPRSIAKFSLTTDAETKPGKVSAYATTYTPTNAPHYYLSFRAKVTGPSF